MRACNNSLEQYGELQMARRQVTMTNGFPWAKDKRRNVNLHGVSAIKANVAGPPRQLYTFKGTT